MWATGVLPSLERHQATMGRHQVWFRCVMQVAAANLVAIDRFLEQVEERRLKGHDANGVVKYRRRRCETCQGRCQCRSVPEWIKERDEVLRRKLIPKAREHFEEKAPAEYVKAVQARYEHEQANVDPADAEAS